jgi:hypothetical protein
VLQDIEWRRGRCSVDIGMPEVAEYDRGRCRARALACGRAAVGDTRRAGEPVRFLMGARSRLPARRAAVGRDGSAAAGSAGAAGTAAQRAGADWLPALTLTTFSTCVERARNTPGRFRILDDAEVTPGCARSGSGRPRSAWTGGRGMFACAAISRVGITPCFLTAASRAGSGSQAVVRPHDLARGGDQGEPGLVLDLVAVGQPAVGVQPDRVSPAWSPGRQVRADGRAEGSTTVSSTAVSGGRPCAGAAAT